MRIIGVLLLSIIPTLWGVGQYININRRTVLLIDIIQIIMTLKERIRFSKTELDKLFAFLLSQPGFSKDSKLLLKKIIKKRNYNDILEAFKGIRPSLLKEEELSLLAEFFGGLGKSDIKGQIELCEFYIAEFERKRASEEVAKTEKSRLSLGLSMALSAGIFIVLI